MREPMNCLPILKRNGQWVSCLHNTLIWLSNNKRDLQVVYDQVQKLVYVNGHPLCDNTTIPICGEIEAKLHVPWRKTHVRDALTIIGHENPMSFTVVKSGRYRP